MFNKQPVGGDVIPVHDQAVRGGVARPAHAGAVVGPPGPDVIDDHVVPVDFEAGGGSTRGSTTNAKKNVLDQRGIIGIAPRVPQDGQPRQ